MKNIPLPFLFLLLLQNFAYSQEVNLYSNENRKLFADYLFCQKDYLRAVNEYEEVPGLAESDTIRFKIGLAYLKMNQYDNASSSFSKVKEDSYFYKDAQMEFYKSQFLLGNYEVVDKSGNDYVPVKQLKSFSYLMGYQSLPAREELLSVFEGKDRDKVADLYERKINPPYKSELTAILLSTIIPGAGKIYTKEYSDGIIAFLVTGIMSYISYTDFKADHNFRGWLFAGLSAFFYAGNIYGSAASAQIYNAKINFSLDSDMKLFLEDKNYFVRDYEFCK